MVRRSALQRLEPTSGRAPEVRVETLDAEATARLLEQLALHPEPGSNVRVHQVVRADGEVARSFLFVDEALLALQWTAGSPWATRVERDRWRDLERSWRQARGRPVEASVQHR